MEASEIVPAGSQKIELNDESVNYLKEIRRWANFLAILGFVFIGLMVVLSISFSSFFSQLGAMGDGPRIPGFLFASIYIFGALLYFFPILYLFRFASFAKKGIDTGNANEIASALMNLKSHYKYIGICAIVVLVIYGVALLIMLLVGGLMNIL